MWFVPQRFIFLSFDNNISKIKKGKVRETSMGASHLIHFPKKPIFFHECKEFNYVHEIEPRYYLYFMKHNN
jgi:hypothetical protein